MSSFQIGNRIVEINVDNMRREIFAVTTNGQTVFPLSNTPKNPPVSQVVIDSSHTIAYGIGYNIVGSDLILINNSYNMEVGETIEIIYQIN